MTNRALLVIDVQESFRARPDWAGMNNQHIAHQVGRLVNAARAAGDPVIWVLHSEPDTGGAFDPAHGHVRVMSELQPREDELLIVKTSVNAFTSTDLEAELVRRGIDEVVICGIRTEQCCETTARVASDLGFDVVFVTDATTTSGIDGLPADQIIDRTERVLREREFATIARTDELAAALTGS